MYQPYGIGFSRDILIKEYNAQNVIYGKKEEKDLFEKFGMGWRFLELDVEKYDFEYLREWRIHTNNFDFSKFPKEHMIVIAPTNDKLLDFVTKEYYVECWDYDEGTGEAFEDLTEMYERSWKGTSLEEIRARKFISSIVEKPLYSESMIEPRNMSPAIANNVFGSSSRTFLMKPESRETPPSCIVPFFSARKSPCMSLE